MRRSAFAIAAAIALLSFTPAFADPGDPINIEIADIINCPVNTCHIPCLDWPDGSHIICFPVHWPPP